MSSVFNNFTDSQSTGCFLVNNDQLSDVAFLFEKMTRKVFAHRCVLSCASDYFFQQFVETSLCEKIPRRVFGNENDILLSGDNVSNSNRIAPSSTTQVQNNNNESFHQLELYGVEGQQYALIPLDDSISYEDFLTLLNWCYGGKVMGRSSIALLAEAVRQYPLIAGGMTLVTIFLFPRHSS